MRALPPFDALVAFDAVLRHASMTRAAGELGLTQSAVSHRLRKLEAFLGTNLLTRSPAGLAATPAGLALADVLGGLLDGMADVRARCRAAISPATLKVGVGAALADYWLVRRLPRFTAAHPAITVELAIVDNEARVAAMDLDLHVLWLPAASARASSTQRLLFQERVFPVCAPALLQGGGPAELARLPILHKGAAGGSGREWSWPVWFARLGLAGPPPSGLRFATIGTAIAASLQGAGVVLARSLLVHDALADGRLCRVLPEAWDMPSSKAHIVRWPAALGSDERVRLFVAWLVAMAAETSQPGNNGSPT